MNRSALYRVSSSRFVCVCVCATLELHSGEVEHVHGAATERKVYKMRGCCETILDNSVDKGQTQRFGFPNQISQTFDRILD